MYKRITSLLLVVTMLTLIFTGCGNTDGNADSKLGVSLKVGSYNIGHCENWETYLTTGESVIDVESVTEMIREMDVDICGLQEVLQDNETTGQAQEIADALGWNYVFAPALDSYQAGGMPDQMYGIGLISRYPITSYETIPVIASDMDKAMDSWGKGPYTEDRVVIVAQIDVDGNPITVITTHVGLADSEKDGFLQVVTDAVNNAENPVIVMGDMNMQPDDERIKQITELLQNTATVNPEVTYTFPGEELFIDYIFVPKNATLTSFNTIDKQVSDHLPIFSEFEF